MRVWAKPTREKRSRKRNNEEQSVVIIKKDSKIKYVKNAKHSQTDILFCGLNMQRKIKNMRIKKDRLMR